MTVAPDIDQPPAAPAPAASPVARGAYGVWAVGLGVFAIALLWAAYAAAARTEARAAARAGRIDEVGLVWFGALFLVSIVAATTSMGVLFGGAAKDAVTPRAFWVSAVVLIGWLLASSWFIVKLGQLPAAY